MSLSRFYLSAESWQSEILTLCGDEAAHCSRVLRRECGDDIEIFDGEGRVAIARITQITKQSVSACIQSQEQPAPRASLLHLLPAMIKAEPFEWLLEKATELGAASIRPVITTRTVVHLSGDHLDKKLVRWQRHMIEAAKQCHTPWLPRLEPPQTMTEACLKLPPKAVRILPALSEHARHLDQISLVEATEMAILIGPEGDFTAAEEAFAQEQGFQPVTLGPLILRAETAAITALAVVAHERQRQLRLG